MATINDNVVALMELLVDLLRKNGTIITNVFDSGANTSTLEITDEFDILEGKYLLIDGVQYRVNEFTAATGVDPAIVVVTSEAAIVATEYQTAYPFFFHGTYQMVNSQMGGIVDNNAKSPAVFMFYNIEETRMLNNRSAFISIQKLSFAFLGESNVAWTSQQHQSVFDAQNDACEFFLSILQSNQFVGKMESATKTHMANFGTFISNKGALKHLVAMQMTGVLLQIDVPFYTSFEECNLQNFQPVKCAPGLIVDGDGNLIQLLGASQTYVDASTRTGYFDFLSTGTDVAEVVSAPANLVGTYTGDSNSNVDTVVYELDTGGGYGVVVFPFSIALGNGFKSTITRTIPANDSTVQING